MEVLHFRGFKLHVSRRSNVKRISLRHRNGDRFFTVSMPPWATGEQLADFLSQQEGWMREQIAGIEASEYELCGAPGERSYLLGEPVTLGVNGIPSGNAFLSLRNRKLYDVVVRLLPVWQQRMGVRAKRIRWREMTSRWGSCVINTGVITLNTSLGAMPEPLIEYILVHELCHLIYPDHSPAFHAEMTRFIPDWKQRKERLDHFGQLFLPPLTETGQGEK